MRIRRKDVLDIVLAVAAGRDPFHRRVARLGLAPLNEDVGEGWPAAVYRAIAEPQAAQRTLPWHAKRFWPVSASTLPSVLPGPNFYTASARRAVEERAGTLPHEELPYFESDTAYVAAAEADPSLWEVHLLRGTHLESFAVRAFVRAFRVRIFEAPSILHESGLFTASPDGIGRTRSGQVFLVEIKVPFHTKTMEDLVDKYFHQVQAQLAAVPDAAYAMLVQYCWRDGAIEVRRVDRDAGWFAANERHIRAFNDAVRARRVEAGITPESWADALCARFGLK